MQPHLISAKVCPFVQRAVILLKEKGVDHKTTYIDLKNKPDWFVQMSPRGKGPVLEVGDDVLFESQAVCGYLEEAVPERALMPSSLVERARARAWYPFAGEDLFVAQWKLVVAKDKASFDEICEGLKPKLERLTEALADKDFLTGDGRAFGMADVAVAPFFSRTTFLQQVFGIDLLAGFDSLKAWGDRILQRPSVQASLPEGFEDATLAYARAADSHLAALAGASKP